MALRGTMRSFFFRAEDGIRDGRVTGVQTCARPIYHQLRPHGAWPQLGVCQVQVALLLDYVVGKLVRHRHSDAPRTALAIDEDRKSVRVGKEGRSRGVRQQQKKEEAKECSEGRFVTE